MITFQMTLTCKVTWTALKFHIMMELLVSRTINNMASQLFVTALHYTVQILIFLGELLH